MCAILREEKKVDKINEALFAIQSKELKFAKNATGGFGKYVTFDDIMEKLLPELAKHKLVIIHRTVEAMDGFQVQTSVTCLEDGSMVLSSFPLRGDLEPQKAGGAITYAKRYNVGQLFNMVIDVDDDGAASSPQNTRKFNLK